MNEPHTDDGFEATLKLSPGSILCAWVAEMTAFIKSLDSNHLIATGEEGYRADLTADSSSHSWLNNGLKGGDFVCNTCRTGLVGIYVVQLRLARGKLSRRQEARCARMRQRRGAFRQHGQARSGDLGRGKSSFSFGDGGGGSPCGAALPLHGFVPSRHPGVLALVAPADDASR
jgi:hypothetical protein